MFVHTIEMKYLIIIFGTLALFFTILFLLIIFAVRDFGHPNFEIVTLTTQDNSSKLYIKSKNWGVMGDHQITIISTDDEKEFEADTIRDYVFKGLEPFLYKVINDSLFLYVGQRVKTPPSFNSKWTIMQVEIKNSKFSKMRLDGNFKKIP